MKDNSLTLVDKNKRLEEGCFHCGEPIPKQAPLSVTVDGKEELVCCIGCRSVVQLVTQSGFKQFYQMRDQFGKTPSTVNTTPAKKYQHLDNPKLNNAFTQTRSDGHLIVTLHVEGMVCSACAWLIENYLEQLNGIIGVNANLTLGSVQIEMDPSVGKVSDLFGAIEQLGYSATPHLSDQNEARYASMQKQYLMRLGLAGVGMMQVMMYAIALYGGALSSMEAETTLLLRWMSLAITTPVVLYSAAPFFQGAWRSIRHRHLGMDIPIALAISLAFSASVWGTLTHQHEVYFDSVVMFTFFLLIARYFEFKNRFHNIQQIQRGSKLPDWVTRINKGSEEQIPVSELKAGDLIRVAPGERLSIDGTVRRGTSHLNQAMVTGEFLPILTTVGETVCAGAINIDTPLEVEVTKVGSDTWMGQISKTMTSALNSKTRAILIADNIASRFIIAILTLTAIVGSYWWIHAPSEALPIVLSLLVVTCPCALSLAVPSVMTQAIMRGRNRGALVTQSKLIEQLNRVTDVVFDKTGTLTEGRFTLVNQYSFSDNNPDSSKPSAFHLSIAAALETDSRHPIATAFREHLDPNLPPATNLQQTIGKGIQGEIAGVTYRIGNWEYAVGSSRQGSGQVFSGTRTDAPSLSPPAEDQHVRIYLSCHDKIISVFDLKDRFREDAKQALSILKARGLKLHLISGDRPNAVAHCAEQIGIRQFSAEVLPDEKLAYIRQLQDSGSTVLMVGDGINDAPVLAGADVAITTQTSSDLSQSVAGGLLLNNRLCGITDLFLISDKATRIIYQNIGWAVAYNVIAIPLAAVGLVPAYMAAIGMSTSSLIVVSNAMRLKRIKLTENHQDDDEQRSSSPITRETAAA